MEKENVLTRLETQRYGRSIELLERATSTNDVAREAARLGAPDGHTVVAEHQTHGRGSHGRSWSSPPGTDLYFSVVARTGLAVRGLPPLSLAAGLAVHAVLITRLVPRRVRVKWPNDVLVDGRKISGILVETSSTGAVVEAAVIGIGLNVNRETMPESAPEHPAPTSLCLAASERFDRGVLLAEILLALEREVDSLVREGPRALLPRLLPVLAYRGELVTIDGQRGRLRGLASDGSVELETNDGRVVTVRSGRLRIDER